MSDAKGTPTYRDGEVEMQRANRILTEQLSARLRKRLVPVPSPGRASLVILLYESGKRGRELDYKAYDDRWEELAEGSSQCPSDYFVIVADGESSRVYLGKFLPKLFGQWGERAGSEAWPDTPCVTIEKRQERVTYFENHVHLEHQQYDLLVTLLELSGPSADYVPDVRLRELVDIPDGGDLRPILSRIRHAFREAASDLDDEIRGAAAELVDELLPRRPPMRGYRVGRPELFDIR